MPDYIVLISTLGGMALFGLTGFVIGPVIAALFMAIWDMFTRMQLQDEERRRQLASTSEAHAEYQLSDNMSSEDPSRR
jgi:predicted PurR-regulated permease PerM